MINDLTAVLAQLREASQVLVTGPQRSGTTFTATVLAAELGLPCLMEELIDVEDMAKLFAIQREQERFVIQAPGIAPWCQHWPGHVVFMHRPLEEIRRSRQRIGWDYPHVAGHYWVADGDGLETVYQVWERWQCPALKGRGLALDYHSLAAHPLWVPDGERSYENSRQVQVRK